MKIAALLGDIGETRKIVKGGIRIDRKGYSSATLSPLSWACLVGNSQMVEELISLGTSIDPSDILSPLKMAVIGGHNRIVKRLLQLNGNYIQLNNYKNVETPFHRAVIANNLEMMKLLYVENDPTGVQLCGFGSHLKEANEATKFVFEKKKYLENQQEARYAFCHKKHNNFKIPAKIARIKDLKQLACWITDGLGKTGEDEMVEGILEQIQSPEKRKELFSRAFETCLYKMNKLENLVTLMDKHKIEINKKLWNEAIHEAATFGYYEKLVGLVKTKKVDINVTNAKRATPLHVFVCHPHTTAYQIQVNYIHL